MMQTDILKGPDAFFLGASTPDGFYSLFDELGNPEDGWRLYIVKGGPGTGKSTFMKRMAASAEHRGLYCERIYCSSDPDSLDAVIIPGLKCSIADGTAPHVLEPRYPGVSEAFVDLGQFRNDNRLRENAGEIIAISKENALAHKKCAAFLKAAAAAEKEISSVAAGALDDKKLSALAKKLIGEELSAAGSHKGLVRRRFLRALTPKGITTFYNSLFNICERTVVLEDETGVAAAALTAQLTDAALAAGYDVILCPSFMSPGKGAAQLLIPARRLAFFTANRRMPFAGEEAKTVKCAGLFTSGTLKKYKNRFAFCRKASGELVSEALENLKTAKVLHDGLERYYIDAMDFDAMQDFAASFTEKLF